MTYLTFTPVQVRVVVCWQRDTQVFCFGSAGRRKSVGEDANSVWRMNLEKFVVCYALVRALKDSL
jgi:hypothetical protein